MSAQPYRLPEGGKIDRNSPVNFRFDGRSYVGYSGDTLASALLANGVRTVARSFKYHRPRGILGAGSEDPAGLVQIGSDPETRVPNTRATEQEIFDGLEAFSQNRWPSLRFDLGAVNDLFSAFLPAGFYYKTFMGGPGWMAFEPMIRATAGLGEAPTAPDIDRYEHRNRHCDVLVVGAGPAGLAAARAAAATGARVMVVEETSLPGGRLLSRASGDCVIDDRSAAEWVAETAADLAATEDVTLLTRTCVFGYYSDNWLGLVENLADHLSPGEREARLPRQRLWRVRAQQVVLATGAIERPLVFGGNDRPGVMLAGAVQTYMHRYGVMPGHDAMVFTNNDSAWQAAFDMADAGVRVVTVVDTRAAPDPALVAAAFERGIPVRLQSAIVATSGRFGVSSATVATLNDDGGAGFGETLPCDLIAVSGGWSPNVALLSQSRGQLAWNDSVASFVSARSWQNERSAGAANASFALQDCLREGTQAGLDAARVAGFDGGEVAPPVCVSPASESYRVTPAWRLPTVRGAKAFVDLQDDVTAKDLELAVREGYRSVEHAKRYTTLGMGTDQGKTSSVNGIGILSDILGEDIHDVGVTTYRPPYKPVTFGAIAGQHVGDNFLPRRTTPMHEAHVEAGATFEVVGDWMRARVYPRDGEDFHAALMRECRAARSQIGVVDASTLGKIDIRGDGAREFLNRIYSNAWMKLQPGRCRYGLMLNEDGMVFDDGVTACLADDHFHMTTTTGGAAGVLSWLEDYHQTEWPDLDVYMSSVTEQWAVVSICGPKSPALAAELFDDIDPDPATFAFMDWREGHIAGVPVRVFRISFTGEVSYEINIPARYGLWLWRTVMEKGARYGITPYGTEGMHLLRAEVGFVIVGQDTDGTVTPLDLGMDWAVKKSADFVGRRSLFRADTVRSDRRHFVGLSAEDPAFVIPEGAQLISEPALRTPRTPMIGHVTSSYFSPNLERGIALALVEDGRNRMGDTVYVAGKDAIRPAMICDPDFLRAKRGAK